MSQVAPFHSSVEAYLGSQMRVYHVMLRGLFTCAGLLWILAYVFPFHQTEDMHVFKHHQYQIYLLLLTLWGYQLKRDKNRALAIMSCAREWHKSCDEVEFEHLKAAKLDHHFDVLFHRSKSTSWFPVIFSWILALSAFVLLLMQLSILFWN